jgi:hypothetical protein
MSEPMALNPRRPAFRMPWTGESESEEDQPAQQADAVERAAADAEGAAEAGSPSAELEPTTLSETVPSGTNGSAPDAAPPLAAAPASTPEESAEFLRNLVDAMRGVAETSRDASVGELREAVDTRIAELQAGAAETADELRRKSELDVAAVGDWERSETERIREEAERKRNDRRAQLERQLGEAQAATDRDVEATRKRLADHEQKLTAFFAELSNITDPAAFVVAARKMPQAPELTAPAPAASPPAPSAATPAADTMPPADATPADDPRLAAMGFTPGQGGEAEGDAAAADTVEESHAVEAPAAESSGDTDLARRLAQLDERLSGAEAAVEAPAGNGTPIPVAAAAAPPAAGTDASTAIVVKGLGSFGAITSFKQALERVDGIRGVTLSLGPTGEFVYRASHATEFDLEAAIRAIEGDSATIDRSDGSFQVTVSRTR